MSTGPATFELGVKLRVPFGLTLTVPCAGLASTAPVTVIASPSASRSLPSTATVTGVLIGVAPVSSRASGASFTGVTLSVSVAVDVALPSVAV